MPNPNNIKTYLNNHYEGMTSEKLIQMLFHGALNQIDQAKKGIQEDNPKKRGEHLSKVIAIVSELNASIATDMNDESTQFLRGLYSSILTELPKISITNDLHALKLTRTYLQRLSDIWDSQYMNGSSRKQTAPKAKQQSYGGYGSGTGMHKSSSIFA